MYSTLVRCGSFASVLFAWDVSPPAAMFVGCDGIDFWPRAARGRTISHAAPWEAVEFSEDICERRHHTLVRHIVLRKSTSRFRPDRRRAAAAWPSMAAAGWRYRFRATRATAAHEIGVSPTQADQSQRDRARASSQSPAPPAHCGDPAAVQEICDTSAAWLARRDVAHRAQQRTSTLWSILRNDVRPILMCARPRRPSTAPSAHMSSTDSLAYYRGGRYWFSRLRGDSQQHCDVRHSPTQVYGGVRHDCLTNPIFYSQKGLVSTHRA